VTELLAKSRVHGELTLERHLLDTEQAAMALFRPGSRWGTRWLEFFKLKPDGSAFLRCLRVSALFHDIGKANEEFQRAVSSQGTVAQTLRHEHLSALVMCLPKVRAWLLEGGIDADVCTAAVLSHHLKAREDDGPYRWAQFRHASSLRLHFEAPQVRSIMSRLAQLVGREPPPELPSGVIKKSLDGPWGEALKRGREAATAFRRGLRVDPERRRLLVATKVGLVVADAVASGVFRSGGSIEQWIEQVVHTAPLKPEDIRKAIIEPRLRQVGHGKPAALHPFQLRAAEIGRRGLLLAACGAGKTLAAWAWAEAQARDQQIGRVIFLYPTRGTATEGFRDYAAWAPDGEATLLHGTAEYELERMRDNPPESAVGKALGESEAEARLYALGRWNKRYFSATVDQFLSVMKHRYEAMCLLPALADSAVIFDEVHSFDPSMFEALVAFLKEFDLPVLCMTATLPPSRRAQLERLGLRVFPGEGEAAELADLQAKERAPRYRLRRLSDRTAARRAALDAFRLGRRVLWVVNQVSRAQALADELEAELGQRVLCYHSRFRLCDRQAAHSDTVSAFQQVQHPVIAVTTQVCEMSLDLDADVLVTEECPVTSLVQRFGRSNRHLRRPGVLADLYTYEPDGGPRPYTRSDLVGVEEFLAALDGREFCQADLSRAIEGLSSNETMASGASSLFDSGYYAFPHEFRDLDDFARPCVLDGDLEEARRLLAEKRSLAGLIVPVPRKYVSAGPEWLPRFLGVAASSNYKPSRGFIALEKETA
jgi:CRISPR-associated endonuclease/helicase Cas3